MLLLQKAEAQIQEFSTSEDTDFKSTVMYANFAWVFYHQNQFDKGSSYAKKVETILKKYESPPMQNTLLLDIYGEQGWTYLSLVGKYYQRATECFKKALELDPEDKELNSGYAMAVYRIEGFNFLSKPEHKSVPLLERAVKLNPSDTVLKTLLALKYLDIKNYDQGTMLIEQALQEQPDSPYVLRYVATFYKRKQSIEKAIAILKKVVSLTPTSSAAHYQLAMCYKKLIRMPKASEGQSSRYYRQRDTDAISNALFHAEMAVKLNTTSVAGRILLANVYVKAKEYQKAEELFETTLTIHNIRCTQKQELHLSWAQYLMYSRRSESEALRHFKAAIKIQSETWFRGTAIRELKRIAETMIAQNSIDATGYALLGFIYQQTGQDTTAIKNYEKALRLEPGNQEYIEACTDLQATLTDDNVALPVLFRHCNEVHFSAGLSSTRVMKCERYSVLENSKPTLYDDAPIGGCANDRVGSCDVLKNSLKSRLTKLQCHFTWNLLDEEVDIDKVTDGLYDQIEFLDAAPKYRIYNILAYTSCLSEDYENATAYLHKAEEQLQETEVKNADAKRVIIYANYAWIFYHENQIIKVYKYLKKVQEIKDKFESLPQHNVFLFEMYSEKGFSLLTFHRRHSEEAKDNFEKALDLDPENPELNSSYAIAVYKLEGSNCLKTPLDESFPLLKRAAKINPKNTVVKVFLALKYQEMNNSKEGLILIEDALRGTPEFPYLLRYVAKFYRRQKMLDEAIMVLSSATRLNPTSGHLNHQLAQCYMKKMMTLIRSARKAKLNFESTIGYTKEIDNMVSSAIFHLETATKYKNTFVTAYIALARMYGRAKQYQKAEELFHQLLTIDNLTQQEKQDLHLNWGQHEQYAKNCHSEAIKHYKEVLKIQSPTIFRGHAIKHCRSLAEEILSRNQFDETGIDLLDFIHELDVQC
ncbi:uncharacterized protein ACMZJ9_014282 [Mantella aurantiaca]